MAIDSFPVSRVSSPLQRVLPVRESRAGTRHRIVVNYPAVFGQTGVLICDLAEGGFQVAHRSSLRIGSVDRLELPTEALQIESVAAVAFDVRVVWSRLEDHTIPASYRSGLRIERADPESRNVLRLLMPQLGVADHDAFRRKRRKFESTAAAARVEISAEAINRVQIARRYLLSHLAEALRFYRQARKRLTIEEIRTIEDPRSSYREMTESLPITLAVWEFLGREISLEGIRSTIDNPPSATERTDAPRFSESQTPPSLDLFEVCR